MQLVFLGRRKVKDGNIKVRKHNFEGSLSGYRRRCHHIRKLLQSIQKRSRGLPLPVQMRPNSQMVVLLLIRHHAITADSMTAILRICYCSTLERQLNYPILTIFRYPGDGYLASQLLPKNYRNWIIQLPHKC